MPPHLLLEILLNAGVFELEFAEQVRIYDSANGTKPEGLLLMSSRTIYLRGQWVGSNSQPI